MLETTARSARFASVVQTVHDNTVQQIISTTRPNTSGRSGRIQKIRHQISLRRTEWLSTNATSGESKCGQQQSTSRRRSTPSPTNHFGTPSNHKVSNMTEETFRDLKKASVLTDEESDMFEIKKGTKHGDPSVKLALQHSFCRKHWKTTFRAGKRKKVWESTWVTTTMTASQTWDLLTTCSCLHPPKNSSKNCCANSRGVLKKWDSGSIQGRRKFLATQARTQKRNRGRWHKSRNTDKRRKHEILGPDDYFPATGDDRNQKSNQGCLGDVSQVQTGADIEKLLAQTSTPAIRRSENSDDMLRIRNMDTHRRARKNDSINATQNAPTHHTNEKKIQKDRETKRQTNEEKYTNDE